MDKTGRLVINPQFDWASGFSEGLAAVRIGDDRTGVWLHRQDGQGRHRAGFDLANDFGDGSASVHIGDSKTGKSGYIDKTGAMVIAPQFDWLGPYDTVFSEGLAAVRIGDAKTGKWGYIDKTGKVVIKLQFLHGHSFCDGLAAVRLGTVAL